MNRCKRIYWLAAFLPVTLAVGILTGCGYQATQEGEVGNLEFAYSPADGDTNFDRPIAVGSTLKMYVEPLEGRSLDHIVDVSVSNHSVISAGIDSGSSDAINLEGLSAGEVRIEVEVRGGGERYSDWTTIRADYVDQVEMAHSLERGHLCESVSDAAYLVDREASIELQRQTAGGEQLIGATSSSFDAIDSCQVEMYPDSYQERPYCDEAGLHFSTLPELGTIDIFRAEGIGVAGDGFADMGMHVIEPDRMDFYRPTDDLRVDRTRTVDLEAFFDPWDTDGTWPVCTNMELRIEIYSTDICTGPGGAHTVLVDPDDENELRLRGQRRGTCDFDIHLDDDPNVAPWQMEIPVRD